MFQLTANSTGWNLTDLYGVQSFVQKPNTANTSSELLIFNSDDYSNRTVDVHGREIEQNGVIFYWKAPKSFLEVTNHNWLNSFGSSLSYYVYFVPRDDFGGYQTNIADLIIEVSHFLEYY